jgi:hypothetical protein
LPPGAATRQRSLTAPVDEVVGFLTHAPPGATRPEHDVRQRRRYATAADQALARLCDRSSTSLKGRRRRTEDVSSNGRRRSSHLTGGRTDPLQQITSQSDPEPVPHERRRSHGRAPGKKRNQRWNRGGGTRADDADDLSRELTDPAVGIAQRHCQCGEVGFEVGWWLLPVVITTSDCVQEEGRIPSDLHVGIRQPADDCRPDAASRERSSA